jgi:hypothetical protein
VLLGLVVAALWIVDSVVTSATPSGQAASAVESDAAAVSTALQNSLQFDSASALAYEASSADNNGGPIGAQVLVARGRVRHGGVTLVVRFKSTVQGDESQGTVTVIRCYEYNVQLTASPPGAEQVSCPNKPPILSTPPTTAPPE